MKKRLIAAILSCCMLLGTCGVAYAEEASDDVNSVMLTDGMTNGVDLDGIEDDSEINYNIVQEESEEEPEENLEEFDAQYYGTEEKDIVMIDEEGNLTILDQSEIGDGVIDVPMIATYADSDMIVNFRANKYAQAIPSDNYVEYTEYKTGNSGYINGSAGADAAYLGTENGKVKFMMSGVIGLVNADAVQVVSHNYAKSSSDYYSDGTYLYHRICTDMTTPGYAASINVGHKPSYLQSKVTYYSYDGHYFYTDYKTMISDYQSDTRKHAVNAGNPYYNYFQYLPLRSATKYTGSQLSQMINSKTVTSSKMYNTGEIFVEKQNRYGTNALLIASIGAIESAWGTSSISQAKNNLFGWNAVDATPGESAFYFASPSACIEEYTGIHISQGYLNPNYSTYHGGFLGNKASGMNVSYASDPYWGEKIAAIAWSLDNANGTKDQNQYKLGIKDTVTYSHTNLNIRKEATASSSCIYQTVSNAHYSFIILGESNGFYKIQSDGILNSSRTAIVGNSGKYNAANMYAYASKDYITIVNNGIGGNSNTITGEVPNGGNDNDEIKVELPYTDISENVWYYDAAKEMYGKGLMTGINGTRFAAAQLLDRSQFATIVYRLEGSPNVTYTNYYKDVVAGMWYTAPIIWNKQAGVITGYETGLFGVADPITREQVALILYRYTTYKGYDNSERVNLNVYPDAKEVSDYAKEAMQWAVAKGIITGKNNGEKLDPRGNANRAECATMFIRFLNIY